MRLPKLLLTAALRVAAASTIMTGALAPSALEGSSSGAAASAPDFNTSRRDGLCVRMLVNLLPCGATLRVAKFTTRSVVSLFSDS